MRDFQTVGAAAAGRWPSILTSLGIEAHRLDGRHHDCQGCGGKDRFRFTDDNRGRFICGQGGDPISGDGFRLLQHVHGWSARDALQAVAGRLSIEHDRSPEARQQARRIAREAKRREIERALWSELNLLWTIIGIRLSDRELATDRRFRAARPEWRPMPPAHWEREKLAAERVMRGLEMLYGQ